MPSGMQGDDTMGLQSISRLTVGTGPVGTIGDPEQLNVIRRVMDEGDIWMHCANYGEGSFQNLKAAFSERPSKVPRTIYKVDGITAEGFRTTLRDFLAQTAVTRTDIAQVCGFPLSKEPDAVLAAMAMARRQGTADAFIMEVVPSYCDKVPDYIRQGLFDGYTFYYNVIECAASDAVLNLMERQRVPILTMRTFAGGEFFRGTSPHARELKGLFQKSGCANETEFCVRFALSVPASVTTIAGTSKLAHLDLLLEAARRFTPLEPRIVERVRVLLRRS
jgi:aryl-alcohol dehydrogenase-like predicted oxidoreductase